MHADSVPAHYLALASLKWISRSRMKAGKRENFEERSDKTNKHSVIRAPTDTVPPLQD